MAVQWSTELNEPFKDRPLPKRKNSLIAPLTSFINKQKAKKAISPLQPKKPTSSTKRSQNIGSITMFPKTTSKHGTNSKKTIASLNLWEIPPKTSENGCPGDERSQQCRHPNRHRLSAEPSRTIPLRFGKQSPLTNPPTADGSSDLSVARTQNQTKDCPAPC
jgi:hypothetical protein